MGQDCGGWGQYWGQIPWGGNVCPPEGPTGGFVGGRYERVRREQERRRERQEVLNVLFKVDGLRATGELGKCSIIAGTGRAIQLRRGYRSIGAIGTVEIASDTWAAAAPMPSIGRVGQAEVFLTLEVRVPSLASAGRIGETRVLAQRNITDEELIHMIAEML